MDIREMMKKKLEDSIRRWRYAIEPRRSKRELARRLEVDPSLISCWLNGTSLPSWKLLPRLSQVLGVPLTWWLDEQKTLEDLEEAA